MKPAHQSQKQPFIYTTCISIINIVIIDYISLKANPLINFSLPFKMIVHLTFNMHAQRIRVFSELGFCWGRGPHLALLPLTHSQLLHMTLTSFLATFLFSRCLPSLEVPHLALPTTLLEDSITH